MSPHINRWSRCGNQTMIKSWPLSLLLWNSPANMESLSATRCTRTSSNLCWLPQLSGWSSTKNTKLLRQRQTVTEAPVMQKPLKMNRPLMKNACQLMEMNRTPILHCIQTRSTLISQVISELLSLIARLSLATMSSSRIVKGAAQWYSRIRAARSNQRKKNLTRTFPQLNCWPRCSGMKPGTR